MAAYETDVEQTESRELRESRDLFGSFGNGWMAAFDIALTPLVIAGVGLLLDRRLGTLPILTLVLFFVGVVGMALRMYYGYSQEIEAESAGQPWGKQDGQR